MSDTPIVITQTVKYFTVQNTSDRAISNFECGGLLWTVGAWKVLELPSEVAEAMEKTYSATVKIVDRNYSGTPNVAPSVDPSKIKNAQEGDMKAPPLDWSKDFQEPLPNQVMTDLGIEQDVHYTCANCASKFSNNALYREHLNVHASPPPPQKKQKVEPIRSKTKAKAIVKKQAVKKSVGKVATPVV